MRLIDADALMEQIDIDSKGREGQYGDEWEFIDTIKSAPTIKALYPCNKKRCAHCHIECNLTSDREFALTKADMVVIADACKLETIEPECGEWIPFEFGDDTWHKCSICGVADNYIDKIPRPNGTIGTLIRVRNFCPNCGARMKGADDE